ncbi:hypothetical protein [Streptomyces heilongjiangensis]|uniref:Uncharacterized protein n=1 Tax=Streptomyces heilongjiangensis TaxID=945052 RepID=A0ABW1B5Q4_9ACTN|nr:hypothetical protein [Streptomyces heilongjiangensis]MDC2947840.1 hypothetical protein [Streptomyces heilongjiangensis]
MSASAHAVARHVLGVRVDAPGAAAFLIRPRTGSLTYRVTGTAPGGRGRVRVEPFTDLTGTVLRIGPVGSGTTVIRK